MSVIEEDRISLEEFVRRRPADDLAETISLLVGDFLPDGAGEKLTPEQRWAFGFGPACPCGERGMAPGEHLDEELGCCRECAEAERIDRAKAPPTPSRPAGEPPLPPEGVEDGRRRS